MDLSANHKGPYFEITNPESGEKFLPPSGRYWVFNEDEVNKRIADGRIIFGKTGKARPVQKVFAAERDQKRIKAESWWDKHGYNEDGTEEIGTLLGVPKIFTHPKPTELIYNLCAISTESGDTVLDFFGGSGTTAHAVMRLNADDGVNRKFIIVQYPEPVRGNDYEVALTAGYRTISEIAQKRIHLAGEKVKAELIEKQKKNGTSLLDDEERIDPEALDIGFRVFKTDDTMIRWTHAAIHDDKTLFNETMLSDKEKLDFMPHFTDVDVAYEILLRQHDVPLSAKMEQLTKIGKRTWCFADSYVVCLEEKITPKLVEKLAAIEPTPFKYVFRDSAFGDDIALKDETMRRLDANIKKNTGEKKKTYTVEFL